jgi:phage gp36-like protein
MYLTPADLTPWPGGLEIAQAATPEHLPPVAAALMDATLAGADRSAYGSDVRAVADLALARVNAAITAAVELVNSYIAPRYAAAMPLAAGPAAALKVHARAITRYYLHQHLRVTTPNSADGQHPIHADYERTLAFLRDIASGKLSLGVDDPAPVTTSGAEWSSGSDRLWSRNARALP